MKKEDISKVLSDIDENFIEEAAEIKKRHAPVIRYISIAACLAVAVIAGIALMNSESFISVPSVNTENTTNESGNGDKTVQETVTTPALYWETQENTEAEIVTETQAEMIQIPQWADLAVPMRYTEAKLGDITYSTQATEIPEENILSFLGDTEMQGYDIYTDTTYTVNAKIYSIRSISTDCAVAIKIDGGEEYYVYVNSWYEPDTLGEFIADLDLKNTVIFRKAYIDIYEYNTLSTSHSQIIYADFDDNVIWDMLSDVLTAKNVEYNHPYDRIGVETDLPVLGYKNISFCVTPDGYIITNILNTQKCFFIGTEKFKEFDEYLKSNVPFKEYNTVNELNPDGTIPGKGEESQGQSTPGYNPDEPVQIAPPYNPNEDVIPDFFVPDSSTTPPYMPDTSEIPDDFVVEETTRIK